MLVVEDDPETREMLAEILRADGYDVVEACDGDGAREQVADRRLVIVLTAETATRLGELGTAALVGSPAAVETRGARARRRAPSRRSPWERDGHVV
jgi:CheY-like chemotaxis protein